MITWILLGAAIGFVLEGGGLANPRKLTGVFLLKDWTVPQVMATAIIAAMAGGLVLTLVGFDTSGYFTPPTQFLAQAVGGLIFGVGFFIGGYCPGTSVVALGTGRLDALPFMGGLVGGWYWWDILRPHVSSIIVQAPEGRRTLPELFGLDARLLAAVMVVAGGAVVVMLVRRRPRAA